MADSESVSILKENLIDKESREVTTPSRDLNESDHSDEPSSPITRHNPGLPLNSEPIIIREHPPDYFPTTTENKIFTIEGDKTPPPLRKLIIEKLPNVPEKPPSITVERWLSYPKVRQKVVFNRPPQLDPSLTKPKNFIIEWQDPQVVVKNELKYLGIVEADPLDYVKTHGSELKNLEDLPEFAREIKAPGGLKLASECQTEDLIELYGDVDALRLIDLEKEGLGEYIKLLEKMDTSFESSDFTSVSSLDSWN